MVKDPEHDKNETDRLMRENKEKIKEGRLPVKRGDFQEGRTAITRKSGRDKKENN